jgi:hypothetical protein
MELEIFMRIKFSFACLLLSMITACGSESKDSETLRYQFEQNGCNTGSHEFKKLEDMCQALKDDQLNQGCALSLRLDHFEQSGC